AAATSQSTAGSDRSSTGSVDAVLDATKKAASSTPQSYPPDRMGHAAERRGSPRIPAEGLDIQAGRDGVAHGPPRRPAGALPRPRRSRAGDVSGAGRPHRAARALAAGMAARPGGGRSAGVGRRRDLLVGRG